MLFLIFTFFELIGDIIRNRTPLVTVGDYLLNLIPFILYNVTPLCSLVAVLITFGALSRTSELTAMKATGISLYRIVAPVLRARGPPLRRAVRLRRGLPARRQPPPGSPALRHQGQARPDLPAPRPQVDLRPDLARPEWRKDGEHPATRPHLLLPVLRPRQERLRQPHRLRVRARHFTSAPHLRRQRPLGRRQSSAGCSKTAGSAPSPAKPSPATSPSPSPPSPRSASSPATSRKKIASRRRCPSPSSPATSTT